MFRSKCKSKDHNAVTSYSVWLTALDSQEVGADPGGESRVPHSDLHELNEIANRHGLSVIKDASEAFGVENLKSLALQRSHRLEVIGRYRQAFADVPGITLLREPGDPESSHHFFTIHVERRDDFCRKLKAAGIEASIVHYRNDAYTVFGGCRADLTGLERFSRSYIGLPTHMHLSPEDVEYVITTVRSGW